MSLNQEKNLSLDELIQTYSSLKYNEQKTISSQIIPTTNGKYYLNNRVT